VTVPVAHFPKVLTCPLDLGGFWRYKSRDNVMEFGYFVDKYSDHVFNVTIRYTRNRRDALDVMQDVFVQAYRPLLAESRTTHS